MYFIYCTCIDILHLSIHVFGLSVRLEPVHIFNMPAPEDGGSRRTPAYFNSISFLYENCTIGGLHKQMAFIDDSNTTSRN
jgi:hypothetical protein